MGPAARIKATALAHQLRTAGVTVEVEHREVGFKAQFRRADKLGARLGDDKVKGDLLVLRAEFVIQRSDFGLQPGKMTDKVAETIQLTLSIAGAAPRA